MNLNWRSLIDTDWAKTSDENATSAWLTSFLFPLVLIIIVFDKLSPPSLVNAMRHHRAGRQTQGTQSRYTNVVLSRLEDWLRLENKTYLVIFSGLPSTNIIAIFSPLKNVSQKYDFSQSKQFCDERIAPTFIDLLYITALVFECYLYSSAFCRLFDFLLFVLLNVTGTSSFVLLVRRRGDRRSFLTHLATLCCSERKTVGGNSWRHKTTSQEVHNIMLWWSVQC